MSTMQSATTTDEAPVLVIDVGTSTVRTVLSHADGTLEGERRRPLPPHTPADGLVEFDAAELWRTVSELAQETCAVAGPPAGVAIANQRCSTVVWDADTSIPVAPGLGWQDLRTIVACMELAGEGFRLAPNQTATKAAALWDGVDPDRRRNLRVGTIDTWVAWCLSAGQAFITDPSNAVIGGLTDTSGGAWRTDLCERLRLPIEALATIGPSFGRLGQATVLDGAPPIVALLGDQQASMIGQGAVEPGAAKMTFGTGGMFDICLGDAPTGEVRTANGCFPLACWGQPGGVTWGLEGIMLAAGTNVEWLATDLGIIATVADSAALAASVDSTEGVMYVPSLLGAGTPDWDYGARGTLLGLTRGSTAAHICRAVLEGVALTAADIVRAGEADGGVAIDRLRVDGGMSQNPVFTQALADACGVPIDVSAETEATAVGAGYAGQVALDRVEGVEAFAAANNIASTVVPSGRTLATDAWAEARRRAGQWYPELSAINF